MDVAALFWHGPMRVEASGALCQPGAIQSRALRLCRTAGSWLLRKTRSWRYWSLTADLAGRTLRPRQTFEIKYDTLAVSADGTIVDFGFEVRGKSPLRFDLRALKLSRDPPADHQTIRAKQAGLAVEGWRDGLSPTLDGKPIKLEQYETIAKLGSPSGRGSICAWSRLVPASHRREGSAALAT